MNTDGLTALEKHLGVQLAEGREYKINDRDYVMEDGILRRKSLYTTTLEEVKTHYNTMWAAYDFDEDALTFQKQWFEENFPGVREQKSSMVPKGGTVLDAGCGASFSGIAFFGEYMNEINYIGVDISRSIDSAKQHLKTMGLKADLMQDNLMDLPFKPNTFDMIFTPCVLQHTDSVRESMRTLTKKLKPGGRILLWVYRVAPPIRDFADRYINDKLKNLTTEEGLKAMEPLTKLGIALGKLDATINLEEDIDLLGIPKGEINVQRLFYYYFTKAFYNPNLSFKRHLEHNLDWYRPTNMHKTNLDQLKEYCEHAGLSMDQYWVTLGGISMIGTKR